MVENAIGEMIPKVDAARCTGCSRCERLCPQVNLCALQTVRSCFAAWTADSVVSEGSSSGGIGHILATSELDSGGVVCGCIMGGDATPRHIVTESKVDLALMKGSKYVQSDAFDAYRDVKRLLEEGREVLFVGTPCQIAGLRRYIGGDDLGLFTVDLICHGVPPARYFREHLLKKTKSSSFASISFRTKDKFVLSAESVSGVAYEKGLAKDSYLSAFMCGDIYRESCYACRYASAKRVGDLTIGDFWGLDRSTLINEPPQAVSVVLENTDKGALLLERISDGVVMEQRDYTEAVKGNAQLGSPASGTKHRSAFMRAISDCAFDNAIRKCGLARYFFFKRLRSSHIMAPLRAVKHIVAGRR